MDETGLPGPPGDMRELGERLLRLERLVELGGASRSLTSASVGRGGIRVTQGGSVVIDTGGDLEIVTGNLILGDGKIEGSALKNQIEAAAGAGSSTGRALTETFTTYASASVPTPTWATTAIVQGFGVGRNYLTNTDANIFTIRSRLRLAGALSAENLTPSTVSGSTGTAENFHNLSWEHLEANPPSTITVEYQLRADDARAYGAHSSNRANVAFVVIFMR